MQYSDNEMDLEDVLTLYYDILEPMLLLDSKFVVDNAATDRKIENFLQLGKMCEELHDVVHIDSEH